MKFKPTTILKFQPRPRLTARHPLKCHRCGDTLLKWDATTTVCPICTVFAPTFAKPQPRPAA